MAPQVSIMRPRSSQLPLVRPNWHAKREQWPVLALVGTGVVGLALAAWLYRRQRRRFCSLPALVDNGNQQFEVVFVLGGPGAGKGTQCQLLVQHFGLVHLSAGDLLRDEQKTGGELGEMIKSYIKNGQIVPAEVTIRLLRQAMERSGKRKFLIDGFPRNEENLGVWLQIMQEVARIKAVLFVKAPDEVMMQRLLERGKTSGRADDNPQSIHKRLKVYKDSTMPIIEYFRWQNKVFEVNGFRPVAEVFRDVRRLFNFNIIFVLGGPGAGKGTNCARIVEDFGYEHLSAGDLLRAERNSGSEMGAMINKYIQEGTIVPAKVTIGLLRKAMEGSGRRKFLIDGFPRNEENYSAWKETMADVAEVRALLFLDCPEDVMEKRLLARGRQDDNVTTIKNRFKVFLQDTMPIVRELEGQGKMRRVVADRPIDDVYKDVHKAIKGIDKQIGTLL